MIATAIINSIKVKPRGRVIAFLCRRRSVKRRVGPGAPRPTNGVRSQGERRACERHSHKLTFERPRSPAQKSSIVSGTAAGVDGAQAGLARALEQHEAHPARPGLLVQPHQLEVALEAERGARATAGPPRRPARRSRSACTRLDQAEPRRQVGRHHHAAADRLAMQPGAIAQARLDRVAEGVAEIEDRAQARLALVAGDDVGLDSQRALAPRAPAPACRARASAAMLASIQARNASSAIAPYLITSARPGDEFALRQACRACRGRRPPAAAGRTRRSCSCRADG